MGAWVSDHGEPCGLSSALGWGLSPQEPEDETGVKRGKQKVFLMSRRKVTCSGSHGSAGLLETDSVNNVLGRQST